MKDRNVNTPGPLRQAEESKQVPASVQDLANELGGLLARQLLEARSRKTDSTKCWSCQFD